MEPWQRILKKVLTHGERRHDRTGVGTLALFGEALTFDNRDSFPAVTLKKLGFEQVKAELSCFLHGYDNLRHFHQAGCHIWDDNGTAPYWLPFARFEGDLGRIYGVQWRNWRSPAQHRGQFLGEALYEVKEVDQLRVLVDKLRSEPHGRRHVVTAWNPGELDQMCLPPCHMFFQAFLSGEGMDMRLDIAVYMRSVDLFIGLPFDVASYALLQRLLAKELNVDSGFLTFMLGDTHIYLNHVDQVRTVLAREPHVPPSLDLSSKASLFEFDPNHAHLMGYQFHPAVPAPMNV